MHISTPGIGIGIGIGINTGIGPRDNYRLNDIHQDGVLIGY